jgi:hypothetical protein
MDLEKAFRNVFFTLISQVPMLGIAAAWWAGVLKNPIVAVVLAFIYELGVVIWKFRETDRTRRLERSLGTAV